MNCTSFCTLTTVLELLREYARIHFHIFAEILTSAFTRSWRTQADSQENVVTLYCNTRYPKFFTFFFFFFFFLTRIYHGLIIIVDIYYAPVSARRRRPLLLPCHYQEIIRTISPLTRLLQLPIVLAQTYQHLDCDISLNTYPMRSGRRSKQGKVICSGSQHVGRSGARTHILQFGHVSYGGTSK